MLLHVCDKQKNNKYYANWFQINIFAVAKTIQFEAIQNKNYSVVKTLGCPRPYRGLFYYSYFKKQSRFTRDC